DAVVGVHGNRRDEHVLIRASLDRGRSFANPAGASGRIVDHDIPFTRLQRVVVSRIRRAIPDAFFDVRDTLEQPWIGAATIEQRDVMAARDGVTDLIRSDKSRAAENENS